MFYKCLKLKNFFFKLSIINKLNELSKVNKYLSLLLDEVQLSQNQLKKNVCSDSDWIGNVDLHKYHFTLKIQELILPFSDEQLKNYYYNEELEKSNRYMENLIFLETKNQS